MRILFSSFLHLLTNVQFRIIVLVVGMGPRTTSDVIYDVPSFVIVIGLPE